jgi:hypothetical protein
MFKTQQRALLQFIWSIPGNDRDPVLQAIRFRLVRLQDEVTQGVDEKMAATYAQDILTKLKELYKAN